MTAARVTVIFDFPIDPELYPLSSPQQSLFEAFVEDNRGQPEILVEEAALYGYPISIAFQELP
jgi:hypothetical protein